MKPHKILPIERSEFYRLGTKKDLAHLLGATPPDLKRLAADTNYREWPRKEKNNNSRIIEEPLPDLARLQKRLHALFRKVETPPWLKSGKKGIKPQDNALAHCGELFVINVDIEAFFQRAKREFVYRFLQREFQMREDVASLLAELVTYKGHIPTGTSTSQVMAFWAYKRTFERIHKLCELKGISMTLWVDDITFSSPVPFPKQWTRDINKMLAKVDLRLKMKKTKRYTKQEYKTVTGSAISPEGNILVRNAKRKEILDLLANRRVEDLSLREARSLFGKLASQRQNEPAFFDLMYGRCKAHIRRLNAEEQLQKTSRAAHRRKGPCPSIRARS